VSVVSSPPTPAGWYPDPSGERQWRVWNGREWSSVTKPFARYSPLQVTPSPLDVRRALYLLQRYAIVACFGGLGLLLSTLAHWPGTSTPAPAPWASVAGIVAIGLLFSGSVVVASAVRALQGHWSLDAFIPGLNILSINVLIARRVGLSTLGSTPLYEGAMMVAACWLFHQAPFMFLLLVGLSRSYLIRIGFLLRALDHAPEVLG